MNLLFALFFFALPPCAQEDSTNCYWDAQTRGNGKGTSFISIAGTTIPLG